MKEKIIILAVICLCNAGWVAADEIDVSPGTDQISAAMLQAYPGDVLVLQEGEYSETSTVVTNAAGVSIKGADGAEVIWNCPDTLVAIHVMGDFRAENIIFRAGNDSNRATICMLNQAGSVTEGEEPNAEKNSIFVDKCMFLRFSEQAILTPDPVDGICHPLDTLYVTNSLIYGGYIGSSQGVVVDYGQAKEVKIQNCTAWRVDNDPIKIYGHDTVVDYLHVLVDHCTVYDGASAANPLGDEATGTLCYYMDGDDAIQNNIYYMISDFGFKSKKGNFLKATYDYNLADSIGWGCDKCAPWYYDVVDGGALGINNIIADPMLNNPDAGDFSLKAGSPGIDSASDGTDRGNLIVDWTRAVQLAGSPTAVRHKDGQVINTFELAQNYPNPFNPGTTISYTLYKPEYVTLDIYDILGRKIRTLVHELKTANHYTISWNGKDDSNQNVSSGIYFCRLRAGSQVAIKKMNLVQ